MLKFILLEMKKDTYEVSPNYSRMMQYLAKAEKSFREKQDLIGIVYGNKNLKKTGHVQHYEKK
jgi:hypothetical protein